MKVKNPARLAQSITLPWSPHVLAELNGQQVRVARFDGEFGWHHHDHEDELFYVLQGTIVVALEDRDVTLQMGDMVTIPRGIRHNPRADKPALVMLFEPAGTINTGSEINARTRTDLPEL